MKSFVSTLALAATAQAYYYDKLSNLVAKQLDTAPVSNGFSEIDIEVDGSKKTYYVAASFSSSSSSDYHVPSNGRGYISESPSLDLSNPDYFTPNLLGGSIEWDVDLSDHECGCIAAFYLVSMPGKHDDGSLWMDTDGWGYCDANQVDGNWCPEFDLMEANKWSWATTPHKCDAPNDKGHYYHCDQGGQCAQNITDQLEWSGYGPGDSYTINTDLPFHAKIEFFADGAGQFSTFTTTMTQNGREQAMTGDCSYLNNMSSDLSNGMGFVVSNWGGDASWLWHDRCQGSCNWPELSVSNIKVKTGGVTPGPGPSPTPSPYDPADYDFGDSCGSEYDDDCATGGCPTVDHCRWSWNKSDPAKWSGDTAECRCDYIP